MSNVNILGVPYGSTLGKEIAKVTSSIEGKTVTIEEIQARVDKANAMKKTSAWVKWGIVGVVALIVVSIID